MKEAETAAALAPAADEPTMEKAGDEAKKPDSLAADAANAAPCSKSEPKEPTQKKAFSILSKASLPAQICRATFDKASSARSVESSPPVFLQALLAAATSHTGFLSQISIVDLYE
jgi:hypothetical protein